MSSEGKTLIGGCEMKSKSKPVPPVDLWESIDQEYKRTSPPDGAICNSNIRNKYKCNYNTADGMIRRLIALGKLKELGKFIYKGRSSTFYGPVGYK